MSTQRVRKRASASAKPVPTTLGMISTWACIPELSCRCDDNSGRIAGRYCFLLLTFIRL